MYRYPFYGAPFPYHKYNYYKTDYSSIIDKEEKIEFNEKKEKKSPPPKKGEEEYFFDLLGIHIFLDDILIICLIFFLYNEGIKDEGLFIALILLLLT